MSETAHLFSPLQLRGITLPNRIAVSPMCEYSSVDGFANDWHLVHLGSRVIGGAGLILTEANAVSPEGRITPADLGIWQDEHIAPLARIVDFIHEHGAYAGTQLAHAGRKASMAVPWETARTLPPSEGGWENVLAPSAEKFSGAYPQPNELDIAGIHAITASFVAAAKRAEKAGFDVIEIHAAHGYLLHEFFSPLSNHRTDEYGGSLENRARFVLEVTHALRAAWPQHLPILVRISASDWTEGGVTLEDSIALARLLKAAGADLIDTSSGGNIPHAKIATGPGYQVGFAERIRKEAGILTGAVGEITEPAQADSIISTGQADLVLLAREMLRDPYWPVHAAQTLNRPVSWPKQYLRAAAPGLPARQPAAKPTV